MPLFAAVRVAVRANLGAPILFLIARPGLHGEPFELLRFRVCAALPGAFGTIIVQVFVDGPPDDAATDLAVIEINARYGGGFPLALEAGADFPRWQLEELLGLPSTAAADAWRDGLVMLRYDAAVFVDEADAPR